MIMVRCKGLVIALLFFINGSAQNSLNPVGAEAWGLAGSSVTSQNAYAVFNNPAALGYLQKFQAGIYSEQRFNESKLSTASMAIVAPSKYIHVGLGIHHFGYSLFNQQKVSVALSKQLFKQFSIGATFSYFGTTISEQPHTGNILGELGLLYQATQALTIGLFIFNPTQSYYSTNTIERIPTYARFGVSYSVSEKVKLLGEAEQILNQKMVLRGGVLYQIHEILSLSVGAANNPVYYSFGTGIKLKPFKIDFAASYHEVLGVSPHLSVSFPVKK
jgi:hypothetical protein